MRVLKYQPLTLAEPDSMLSANMYHRYDPPVKETEMLSDILNTESRSIVSETNDDTPDMNIFQLKNFLHQSYTLEKVNKCLQNPE